MDKHPHVLLTGGRGRAATAIRQVLSAEGWTLDVCSRTVGDGMLGLDEVLAGTGPLAVKAVIHCAWSTVPAVAQEHPGRAAEVDVPLLERLIRRMHADPHPPLLVFMSTGAVYGPAPGRPSLESDVTHPLGEYARGKLVAEALVRDSGLPHCILRVSNLYALPSSPADRQGVIARLVWTALENASFQQWGGHSVKDYLHRDDFVAALKWVIEHGMTGVVNVASGTATSLDDLVKLVKRATGRSFDVEVKEAPPWDVTDNRLDITLLRAQTGWAPKVALEDGVTREVARMLDARHTLKED
jgi:UDP-glucose 4-epimerase